MAAEAEIHDNFDTTRLNEEVDFKLIKGKNATTTFLPQTKKGG